MNKKTLIKEIASKLGITQKDISAAIDTFLDVVSDTLANGQEVNITGFGKFTVKERAGRIGRNPRTGESIEIAPSKTIKFKPSSTLKKSVADLA